MEKLEIKCIFSYFRFYRDDSIAIIGELPISSKYPRFCKKIFAQAVGGSDIASYKEGFCISWVAFLWAIDHIILDILVGTTYSIIVIFMV